MQVVGGQRFAAGAHPDPGEHVADVAVAVLHIERDVVADQGSVRGEQAALLPGRARQAVAFECVGGRGLARGLGDDEAQPDHPEVLVEPEPPSLADVHSALIAAITADVLAQLLRRLAALERRVSPAVRVRRVAAVQDRPYRVAVEQAGGVTTGMLPVFVERSGPSMVDFSPVATMLHATAPVVPELLDASGREPQPHGKLVAHGTSTLASPFPPVSIGESPANRIHPGFSSWGVIGARTTEDGLLISLPNHGSQARRFDDAGDRL